MSKICQMLETFFPESGSCFVSVPDKAERSRYTFADLMEGVTPEGIQALNAETAWALEGVAVGEELA